MSGHSKWATTKHKKAANDAKRGKEFARLIKNIEVAARTGGGDPAANPTLDDMIRKAKKASVPNDNIERARKRGSGEEAGGADWQTIMYEGYGPNGVAILIECLTDNRNRAATEVRTAMTKNGGNMAESGAVSYMFTRKGVVSVLKGDLSEDDVLDVWKTIQQTDSYPDIESCEASNGDVYFFSTTYLSRAYAESLAEYNSVERFLCP